jgi:hypothetical protein
LQRVPVCVNVAKNEIFHIPKPVPAGDSREVRPASARSGPLPYCIETAAGGGRRALDRSQADGCGRLRGGCTKDCVNAVLR